MKVWCVRHEDGWCAIEGNQERSAEDLHIPTECGYIVTVPFGCERREPTCPECLEVLAIQE